MDETEKDLRKGFEDVTRRNVQASIDHSNGTRKELRELQDKVQKLENNISAQTAIINQFRVQLAGVQTKLFSGGTS